MRISLFIAAILILFAEVKNVGSYYPNMNGHRRTCETFIMEIGHIRFMKGQIEIFNMSMDFQYKDHEICVTQASANYTDKTGLNVSIPLQYSIEIVNEIDGYTEHIPCETVEAKCSVYVGEINEGQLNFLGFSNTEYLAEFFIHSNQLVCVDGTELGINGSCESNIKDSPFSVSHYFAQCADLKIPTTTTSQAVQSTPTTAVTSTLPAIQSIQTTVTSATITPNGTTGTLQRLANATITSANIDIVLNDTMQTLLTATNIDSAVLYYSSLIVSKCSMLSDITKQSFERISAIIDECLEANTEQFHLSDNEQMGTTSRFLDTITKLFINTPNNTQYLNGKRIALVGQQVNCTEVEEDQIGGIAYDGTNFVLMNGVGNAANGVPLASIHVPRSVMCAAGASKACFVAYRNYNLFVNSLNTTNASIICMPNPENRCSDGDFFARSVVLTATLLQGETAIPTISLRDIPQTMAVLRYSKQTYPNPLHAQFHLARFNDDAAEWLPTNELCEMMHSSDTDYHEFKCQHLTDFALIISGMRTDPSLCSAFLSDLGFVISLLSTLSLAVLFVVYILRLFCAVNFCTWMSRLLMSQPRTANDPIGIIYVAVLFSFFFIFTFFIDQRVSGRGCTIVAEVAYTLLISCIIATMLRSLFILVTFVPMFWLTKLLKMISNIFVTVVIAAVIPSLITVVISVSNNTFFKRDDRFCWIRPDYIALGVVFPLGLVCVNGVICFIMIFLHMFPPKRLSEAPKALITPKSIVRLKIITLFGIQVFLGIPWLMQYLTLFQPRVTIFHYVFTLVNGSQGVILLLIFVFRTLYIIKRQRISYQVNSEQLETAENNRSSRDDPFDFETVPKEIDATHDTVMFSPQFSKKYDKSKASTSIYPN